MNVKEANLEFKNICKMHLKAVQSGKFGECDLEDLDFCGKIHSLLRDLND